MAENTMYIDRVINHEKAKSRRLGRAKAIKEMAKALLKQDMEIEKIAEVTGLRIKEIERLKEK